MPSTLRVTMLAALLAAGCGSEPPDHRQRCTADCECNGNCCGPDGYCFVCARRLIGLCGSESESTLTCSCVGGTCDHRRCCVLADGRIAKQSDDECAAPGPDAPADPADASGPDSAADAP